jgi:Flagellar biosynthesis/type III secretory pathway ATPase
MGYFDYITDTIDAVIRETTPIEIKGHVLQVVGTIIKAAVPNVRIGEMCILRNRFEAFELEAEVVGLSSNAALLTPIGDMQGISTATEVIPTGRSHVVPVGPQLLGRVLDAMGNPLDSDTLGPLQVTEHYPVYADPPAPMQRRIIEKVVPLGLRPLTACSPAAKGSAWASSRQLVAARVRFCRC